jgi:hypothetical protein
MFVQRVSVQLHDNVQNPRLAGATAAHEAARAVYLRARVALAESELRLIEAQTSTVRAPPPPTTK